MNNSINLIILSYFVFHGKFISLIFLLHSDAVFHQNHIWNQIFDLAYWKIVFSNLNRINSKEYSSCWFEQASLKIIQIVLKFHYFSLKYFNLSFSQNLIAKICLFHLKYNKLPILFFFNYKGFNLFALF